MRSNDSPSRVMKAELATEPVRLSYPDQVMGQARDQSEEIIAEAQKASERIRRSALQGAEKERSSAKEEARKIVEAAKAERARVFGEAEEEARSGAEKLVLEEFRPRVEAALNGFEELLLSAEGAMNECLERHKGELVELAVRIGERVILRRAEEDRDLVFRTATAALERARERQEVKISVNPEDLAVLEEYQADLIERFDDLKVVKVDVDRRVDRGGVRVETRSGLIDARIRTQVEEIIKSLLPEAEGGSLADSQDS